MKKKTTVLAAAVLAVVIFLSVKSNGKTDIQIDELLSFNNANAECAPWVGRDDHWGGHCIGFNPWGSCDPTMNPPDCDIQKSQGY